MLEKPLNIKYLLFFQLFPLLSSLSGTFVPNVSVHASISTIKQYNNQQHDIYRCNSTHINRDIVTAGESTTTGFTYPVVVFFGDPFN